MQILKIDTMKSKWYLNENPKTFMSETTTFHLLIIESVRTVLDLSVVWEMEKVLWSDKTNQSLIMSHLPWDVS